MNVIVEVHDVPLVLRLGTGMPHWMQPVQT